jgi:uncharacterized membrane protein YjjP (DUF1212 family)
MRQDERLALELAQRLRRSGASAEDVEVAFRRVTRALDVDLDAHVLNAMIVVSDRRLREAPRTWVLPAEPEEDDLGLREAIEAIAGQVGQEPTATLLDRLRAADAPAASDLTRAAAAAIVAGSTAALLGGGAAELAAATWLGGALDAGFGPTSPVARFASARPLAGVAAAAAATVACGLWPTPIAQEIVVLAALVSRMPGFALTTALGELATGHRVTGGAGLLAATFTLLELGAGAALGAELGRHLGAHPTAATVPIGPLGYHAAVIAFALACLPLLRVRPRLIGWVVAGVAAAAAGETLGAAWVGPRLAGGVGAAAMTLVARAFHARSGLSTSIVQVPAMLLLVPGTVGFRAVQALLAADVDAGVGALFSMGIGATSLVFGALLGEALAAASWEVAAAIARRGVSHRDPGDPATT